jgi:hypothetical protein
MADWMNPDRPEWAEIQDQLHGNTRVRARRNKVRVRRINVVRFSVVLMSLAVAYLATYDVWGLGLPAWIGGLMILAAAGGCYSVERWTP